MHPEPEDPLTAALHRELRQIPSHRAPADLLPRVLAALTVVERRAWWERSWFEWPRAVRRLSGVAAGLAVTSLGGLALLALNQELLHGLIGSATEAWNVVGTLGNAIAVLWQAVPATALLAGGALLAASYFSAIAIGTVFYRQTQQRR